MFDKEKVTTVKCEIVPMKIDEPDFNESLFFSNGVPGHRFVGNLKSLKDVREYD